MLRNRILVAVLGWVAIGSLGCSLSIDEIFERSEIARAPLVELEIEHSDGTPDRITVPRQRSIRRSAIGAFEDSRRLRPFSRRPVVTELRRARSRAPEEVLHAAPHSPT